MVGAPGELAVEEVQGEVGHGLYEGEEFALIGGVVALGFGQGQRVETDRVLTGAVGLFKNGPYGYGGCVGLED